MTMQQAETASGRPSERRWLRTILLLVGLTMLVACADDRALRHLEGLPEAELAFPGATLTGGDGEALTPGKTGSSMAKLHRWFSVDAAEDDVIAWYARELATRGWRRQDNHHGPREFTPAWRKEFLALQLRHFRTEPPAGGVLKFTATLIAGMFSYDADAAEPLKGIPEIALAEPRSILDRGSDQGRSTSRDRVHPAVVRRAYFTDASVEDVITFFETELSERGWTVVDPVPTVQEVGRTVIRAWRKDQALATLYASNRSQQLATRYEFSLHEVLGPEMTPGLPWD